MLRSMFTAINALNLYQSYMDVVSDNLSNSNTTGFKSSRVTFQDQMAQIMSNGAAPSDNLGGINMMQVGLGARMGSISKTFTQGMLQSTGRNTDLAIRGDGFFIFSDGTRDFYSRDGALAIDGEGNLVSATTGMRIQGWAPAIGADGLPTIDPSDETGAIQIPIGSTLARATTTAALTGNLNSLQAGDETVQATIGVYDSLGVLRSVDITFTHTDADARTWTWTATGDGASGTGSLEFDEDGQLINSSGDLSLAAADGAPAFTVALDVSQVTQLATQNSIAPASQNGLAAGSLVGFDVISETGQVMGVYSNGMKQLVGQVALATFINPVGLTRIGQNLFAQGLNSGEPEIGAAGSGTRGSFASGFLEASNVDLAQEFTNMIIAQRGFQASSRVITTSDEMLQELVNIKR